MANQDDVINIKTVESITTSVLDYFLNIGLVTKIADEDLVTPESFSPSGKEEYNGSDAVAEKFKTTSKIYKMAKNIFDQKTNNGVNQSEVKRLVVIKREDTDESILDCLNRIDYKNSYFMTVNPEADDDIDSANTWVNGYRKMLFVQSTDEGVSGDGSDDIASTLGAKSAGRCAFYYHKIDDESLANSLSAIMASTPIGRKTASFKKPTGITVDELTSTEEANLKRKNVNYYVPYIGGAGDYSTRYLTSDNGVTLSGDEIQKVIAVDRIVLSLQAGLMDVLELDIPYDDNGGTIVFDKVNSIFAELKREGIFAADSVDEETGEMLKSYVIKVLPRATVKKYYPDYFAQKSFIIETTVQLAGSAKKITLTLAY